MKPAIAPYHAEVAGGADIAHSVWLHASDGVRLRAAIWHGGARGTVFILPGRTEFVEKYALTAGHFVDHGLCAVSIDWRGQGLSDRLIANPALGHVRTFADYQLDFDALINLCVDQALPRPWFILAHSMGGAIGLRALLRKRPVSAAVFSAPMWGIAMGQRHKLAAWLASPVAHALGVGNLRTPTTAEACYVLTEPFETNALTSDPAMYALLRRQAEIVPEFALAGPSLSWLAGALFECRRLQRAAAPDTPALTFIGGREEIVDPRAVHAVMAKWPNGSLVKVSDARHEFPVERPEIRTPFLDQTTWFFIRHGAAGPKGD